MVPRKRGRDEMESSDPPKETSLLDRIRNMWEFACVMQYIFTFGKAVRIDEDFDIEVPATNSSYCSRHLAFRLEENVSVSAQLTQPLGLRNRMSEPRLFG